MEIKILHLYPEAMNLYGEYGNISILSKYLTEEGINVCTERVLCGEDFEPSNYSLIYIGCGTESASYQVLGELRRHRDKLKDYISSGGILLATGNSFELFGKKISDISLGDFDGLELFEFTSERTHDKRFLSDAIFTLDESEMPVIGFINKCSEISGIDSPLFGVKMGFGNDNSSPFEGIVSDNFIGTSLIGPLLVRNPHVCRMIMEKLYLKIGFTPEAHADMSLQENAYSIALNELSARIEERK